MYRRWLWTRDDRLSSIIGFRFLYFILCLGLPCSLRLLRHQCKLAAVSRGSHRDSSRCPSIVPDMGIPNSYRFVAKQMYPKYNVLVHNCINTCLSVQLIITTFSIDPNKTSLTTFKTNTPGAMPIGYNPLRIGQNLKMWAIKSVVHRESYLKFCYCLFGMLSSMILWWILLIV